MGINNGDIAAKTINLIINANNVKLTGEMLKNAILQYFNGNYAKRGRVTLNQLAKGGKIEGIEISKANIADFRRVAAKYNVQYALSRNADKSAYYVMFSSSRTANIEKAFKEYASLKVRSNENRSFCREKQREFRDQAIRLEAGRSINSPERTQKHEKVIER